MSTHSGSWGVHKKSICLIYYQWTKHRLLCIVFHKSVKLINFLSSEEQRSYENGEESVHSPSSPGPQPKRSCSHWDRVVPTATWPDSLHTANEHPLQHRGTTPSMFSLFCFWLESSFKGATGSIFRTVKSMLYHPRTTFGSRPQIIMSAYTAEYNQPTALGRMPGSA